MALMNYKVRLTRTVLGRPPSKRKESKVDQVVKKLRAKKQQRRHIRKRAILANIHDKAGMYGVVSMSVLMQSCYLWFRSVGTVQPCW
ncbi:uncharacterized protein [Aegilops tauschii subsp. strangulata]|uniref:uncharacterized protein isoform X5 n=1 Tax=Aegilops tauschii subsp. strangulata TaxID=200361 RepID=UPI003CC8B96C